MLLLFQVGKVTVAGDAAQPYPHITVSAEAVQRPHGAKKGFLCDLLGNHVARRQAAHIFIDIQKIVLIDLPDVHAASPPSLSNRLSGQKNITEKFFFFHKKSKPQGLPFTYNSRESALPHTVPRRTIDAHSCPHGNTARRLPAAERQRPDWRSGMRR